MARVSFWKLVPAAGMLWVWLGLPSAPAASGPVLVAAASSMKFAFDEMVQAFEDRSPDLSVKLSFGSSGNLYSQIKNGAPFDVYFSADLDYPVQLEDDGLSPPGTRATVYAEGRLVLWARHDTGVDPRSGGLEVLTRPAVRHIALANPRLAPYGRAAVEAMKSAGLYDRLRPKLVKGENISQAAQFAYAGAAQVGFLARSLAQTDKMSRAGTLWNIPETLYQPIRQGYLRLKNGRNPDGARRFVQFVTGARGQEILKRHGFGLPAAPTP